MKVKEHYTQDHTLEDANSMPDPEYDEERFKEFLKWDNHKGIESLKSWCEETPEYLEWLEKKATEKTERELF